jgi:hypothetical protein
VATVRVCVCSSSISLSVEATVSASFRTSRASGSLSTTAGGGASTICCTRPPITITRMIRMPTMLVTTSRNESCPASLISAGLQRAIVWSP